MDSDLFSATDPNAKEVHSRIPNSSFNVVWASSILPLASALVCIKWSFFEQEETLLIAIQLVATLKKQLLQLHRFSFSLFLSIFNWSRHSLLLNAKVHLNIGAQLLLFYTCELSGIKTVPLHAQNTLPQLNKISHGSVPLFSFLMANEVYSQPAPKNSPVAWWGGSVPPSMIPSGPSVCVDYVLWHPIQALAWTVTLGSVRPSARRNGKRWKGREPCPLQST